MCGICGFVCFEGASDVDSDVLIRMSDTLVHRGPDSRGEHLDGNVAFANRRLSIVDLDGGSQPKYSEDGTVCVVYNGEIYNHNHLRKNLNDSGYAIKWKGTSDTETLLACIDHWGLEKSLKQLVGMFSFSLWDKKTKRLFLARDRFGEKPLYYGYVNKCFVFGSEVKSFKKFPGFEKKINIEALHSYFSLNVSPIAFNSVISPTGVEVPCVLI